MPSNDIDAVRADGGLVHIRPVQEGDRKALLALNERASDQSIFYRFFTLSRHAADDYVERLLRPASIEHQALVALVDDELVGVAAFERLSRTSAEIALLVDDDDQHEGIGTLLIEHLAGIARRHRIQRFVAEVLAENAAMIRVIRNLGFATEAASSTALSGSPSTSRRARGSWPRSTTASAGRCREPASAARPAVRRRDRRECPAQVRRTRGVSQHPRQWLHRDRERR